MTLDELTDRIERLAWREQMDFEATERGMVSEQDDIEHDIRCLARGINTKLLDALEQDGGYPAWVLRLSLHVTGDNPHRRARRYADDPDSEVRYLASRLLE